MGNIIRLTIAIAVLMVFSNTIGSIITLAQTLDRVTADKVSQIASQR